MKHQAVKVLYFMETVASLAYRSVIFQGENLDVESANLAESALQTRRKRFPLLYLSERLLYFLVDITFLPSYLDRVVK